MLIDPFPNPDTHLVATDHAFTSQLLMLSATKYKTNVLVTTRSKDYGNPSSSSNNQAIDQPNTSTSTSSNSIPPPIAPELTIKPPKGFVHKYTFNPQARATQNYNIVEDLAQSPSAMLTLEVLQNCHSQKHALLSAIGGLDPMDSNLAVFNLVGYTPQLPSQLAFLIQVNSLNHLIPQTIVDEGASTCIMSMNCWKTLGSPPLSLSPTTLKAFDSRTYTPYGILSNPQIELWGKTVTVEVEVIDRPLEYNILLGRPWVYAMVDVVSTYFRMIAFPHKGEITVIDQLAFFASSSQSTGSIPLVHGPPISLHNIGVGLVKDSSLMDTFSLPSLS